MGCGWGEKGFASAILAFSQMCLRVHSAVFLVRAYGSWMDTVSLDGQEGICGICFPFYVLQVLTFLRNHPEF